MACLLSIAALGCQAQSTDRKSVSAEPAAQSSAPAATESRGDSSAMSTAAVKPPATHPTRSAGREVAAARATSHVLLTSKGCVQFQPDWTSVRMGESLTWKSDLKSQVVIHVSPGAFDRTRFVVRAGATVSTGPARSTGSFSIWTEPAACQVVPHGVQGPGPGLTVEGPSGR
jgi:hypothetical protein